MAWRPHGRASVNPRAPSAWAVCDRCGLLYNHSDLAWQYDWRGQSLANTRFLVCTRTCLDVPNEQFRPLNLPPDPPPVKDPRPESFSVD